MVILLILTIWDFYFFFNSFIKLKTESPSPDVRKKRYGLRSSIDPSKSYSIIKNFSWTFMFLQVLKALSPLVVIVLCGTFGYHLIEGWNLFDSLYMTVVSLTTVGYSETHPLSDTGKAFTMVLIISGIGNVAIVIRNFSAEFINSIFKNAIREHKMEKRLKSIKNHYIVCGYGRMGRDVSASLIQSGRSVVLIDSDPEHFTEPPEALYLIGDASNEEILLKAGIKEAKGLISTVHSDASNVFITLTARELNPQLYIISRFELHSTEKKLRRAGADYVINPYKIGGQKISQIILKPTVSKILDFAQKRKGFQLNIEELDIRGNNPLLGQTLRECKIRDHYNVIIIAVEKNGGSIITNPGPDYQFEEYDRVVMIADHAELQALMKKYN